MYFIAIVAPDDINQQVVKWKQWMKERHGCQVALRSPAHITLVPPFWMDPALEEELINSMTAFSRHQNKFVVRLADFSHFDHRVIFIEVINNDELTGLQNELYGFLLKSGKYPLKKDDRLFHPHVTIATRDLHKKAFYEAWEHFKDKKYRVEWLVQAISLLRHNGAGWEVTANTSFV